MKAEGANMRDLILCEGKKIFGMVFLNTGVITFVNLANIESVLKILVLSATLIYTGLKIFGLLKEKKKKKSERKNDD